MHILSLSFGFVLLGSFSLVLLVVSWALSRRQRVTADTLLVANRSVGWFMGGMSIAASWIWAPALFLSSQFAYEMGLAGIFWFLVPNIIALALFAFVGPRIRAQFPLGYTLPQYMAMRLKSKWVGFVYMVPATFYQIMAITVQLFAGGSFITVLTGIPLFLVMPLLLLSALLYTLISGLRASLITDVLQMSSILLILVIIVPWAVSNAGGLGALGTSLSGISGSAFVFDSSVMFSFGIMTAISLLTGTLVNEQNWQRVFSIRPSHMKRAFLFGAGLFALVPMALSLLGFLAVNGSLRIILPDGVDTSLIGLQTVINLLPFGAVILFVVMLLAGLLSTLDSALSAASTLWVTGIMNSSNMNDTALQRSARVGMLLISGIGLALALLIASFSSLGLDTLFWILNGGGIVVVVPTLLSLYWNRLTAKGTSWGVLGPFILGMPLFMYGNSTGQSNSVLITAVGMLLVSGFFCFVFRKKI